MDDPAPEACETCGAGPVQRVLLPVAVHFKGSGFYSTDYGRSRKPAAKDGGEGDGPSSDKPSEPKPEKKAAEPS